MTFPWCLVQAIHATDTNAVIPYKDLSDMFQPMAEIDRSKLEVLAFVSSTNKAVHPSDITLTIRSARGMIPVTVNTNGEILKFPLDQDLLRENPPVLANQPKGSIQMVVTVQFPVPEGLTFRYRLLGDGAAEMNKAIRKQAGWVLSLLAPKVQGAVFRFPTTSARKATVEIAAASGAKKYVADAHGVVTLPLNPSLVSENPEVRVSEKPLGIYPEIK